MQEYALIPPADLIVQNGIGVGRPGDVANEFHEIGHGLIAEMIRDGCITPDARVLDVGSGLGRLSRALTTYLSPRGSYEGIDVTKSSVEWCQEAYRGLSNFRFTHADVFNTHYNPKATVRASSYRFPFDDASFDCIFSTSLFTHLVLTDAWRYLSEMARVLRPSGRTWNTFMLLDRVSEPLAINAANPNVRMPHVVAGARVVLPHDPEAVIGLYTSTVAAAHREHGLRIDEVRNGPWSGRTDDIRASYQDVIIATKA